MRPLAAAAVAALGRNGALAGSLPGYRERAPQAEMAEAVVEAIETQSTLLLEAGTGTGKTMAYLLPALLSGRRTIVSTGTRHLQDQIYRRDLPLALAALGLPRKTALLKGRANYLCRHRLKQAAEQASGPDAEQILSLRQFLESSRSGEISDYGRLADDSPLRPRVTSTADNCLGKACEDFQDCFVVAARRRALDADIVIVNHHLLFADFNLREAGFGEILPGAEVVIVDEAHQLPDLAASAFGERLSSRQLADWQRDYRQWLRTRPRSANADTLTELAQQVARCSGQLETLLAELRGRVAAADFLQRFAVRDCLEALSQGLQQLAEQLLPEAGNDEDGRRLLERLDTQNLVLRDFLGRSGPAGSAAQADDAEAPEPVAMVRWAESSGGRGGALCVCPADASAAYARATTGHEGAWIYVSATLSDGHDFRLFRQQLGLPSAAGELRLEPIFDYAEQTRLWLPEGLPDPGGEAHTRALVQAVLPVIAAAGGGAFFLMTTHRAVQQARELLRADGRFQLFVQGEDDRHRLLSAFEAAPRGVLVGAASFWEGVDVPGSALRVVIIDKLPFAPPGDPVVQARAEAVRAAGGDPFRDHHLPQAMITLRQGVGRLIRRESDRGLLVIGDPRIARRGYGRRVLGALPPMPLLASAEAAQDYAASLDPLPAS